MFEYVDTGCGGSVFVETSFIDISKLISFHCTCLEVTLLGTFSRSSVELLLCFKALTEVCVLDLVIFCCAYSPSFYLRTRRPALDY